MTSYYIESEGLNLTFSVYEKWRKVLEYFIKIGYKIQAVGWN